MRRCLFNIKSTESAKREIFHYKKSSGDEPVEPQRSSEQVDPGPHRDFAWFQRTGNQWFFIKTFCVATSYFQQCDVELKTFRIDTDFDVKTRTARNVRVNIESYHDGATGGGFVFFEVYSLICVIVLFYHSHLHHCLTLIGWRWSSKNCLWTRAHNSRTFNFGIYWP